MAIRLLVAVICLIGFMRPGSAQDPAVMLAPSLHIADGEDLLSRTFEDSLSIGTENSIALEFEAFHLTPRSQSLVNVDDEEAVRQASLLQRTPLALPRNQYNSRPPASLDRNIDSTNTIVPVGGVNRLRLAPARPFSSSGDSRKSRLGFAPRVSSFSVDRVKGDESLSAVATDLSNLLKKTNTAPSVTVQHRSDMAGQSSVRGSKAEEGHASGSYWVPARIDLDTALSKIDSRVVDDVLVIPGPYSSLFGPAHNHIDFELLHSPRFQNGIGYGGRSGLDFGGNGSRLLALQGFAVGNQDWGMHGIYVYRNRDNYRDGNGNAVAAGYESSELALALGRDFRNGIQSELSLLRLDQNDVELPGYVFDIDDLETNAVSGEFQDTTPVLADESSTEFWFNRTKLFGNAQSPSKRAQFPLLDRVDYRGFTDVDSLSAGYRKLYRWSSPNAYELTVGHDLRYIQQELNEIADATTLGGRPKPLPGRNSPIPRSYSVNPGLFIEYTELILDTWNFRTGGRLDYLQTDVIADAGQLNELGLGDPGATFTEIVGTSPTNTDRFLWSLYSSVDRPFSDSLIGSFSFGFSQRPPNLTELYAAQPFMVLIQNGLNAVTGDPTLDAEKRIQFDLTLDYSTEFVNCGFRVFHAWTYDHITYENTHVITGPPLGEVQQISLRYVNTDLATLAGGEAFAELFPKDRLSPFMILKGLDGRDRTRNGNFATTNGESGSPSQKDPFSPRGFESGIAGSDAEPLPGISPFEITLGLRLQDIRPTPAWMVEIAARIVDNQDRVATSLLENPTPGFTVYNLRGIYRPVDYDGLTLVAGLENLTDKAYREHLDFRSPNGIRVLQQGVNAYLGVDFIY